ncbi:GNAT family N-acetyltransferase [Alkalibacter mobilis]|uniref:GNAT family N-acetyltransferase n=1 Tax=Alkalibacter mobilis TaxID=2787712 RepID=UPI00189F687E|nr:GNAT family N-acetyltransferase [Alkalibacter mobilis]MBF7096562.1 GNAT family N-acetyltransferase [Alkalibacter mobilis]
MILETDRLELISSNITFAKMTAEFYSRNKDFLKNWEPERTESFYESEYQFFDLVDQIKNRRKDLEYRFWIFKAGKRDRIIGSASLSGIIRGNFQSCFLGYKIDGRETNQGYMTEACERLIRYAFEDLKLHRIEINVIPDNDSSNRVVEKLMFRREGFSPRYLFINGKWKDHIRYAMTREDWINDQK